MEEPADEEREAWLSLIICLQVYSGPFSWASGETEDSALGCPSAISCKHGRVYLGSDCTF